MRMGLGSLMGLSALELAACSTGATSASTNNQIVANANSLDELALLFMVFWGSATRNTLTNEAFKRFHQIHPNITIGSSYSGNDVYYTKLDARIAAKNAPDLIQMDMRYISHYVRNGSLLDLTNFIYNQTINLSDFNPVLLNSSKVNNTIYGVPLGSNYQCMFYNKTLIDKADVGALPSNMTWDTFKSYTTELSRSLGNGVYGTSDNSGNYDNFEIWIRERGKELYTRDGLLAFNVDDVTEWYDYWDTMRKANACLPTKLQAHLDLSQTPTDSSLVKGQSVFSHFFSNQFVSFQQATPQTLGISVYPKGDTAGIYLKVSQLLSISSTTKYPAAAAAFLSFITDDPGGVGALGFERGVPGSTDGLAYLQPLLSPQERVIANFMVQVANNDESRAKEVLDPPAAGQITKILQQVSLDIGNGKITVSEGGKNFFAQATKATQTQTN
jgi:multiple sugar transport system substrate-binding protein